MEYTEIIKVHNVFVSWMIKCSYLLSCGMLTLIFLVNQRALLVYQLTSHGILHHGSWEVGAHQTLVGGVWNLVRRVEEENEEETVVDHAHRTEVSDHQMGEGRVEDVADKVVVGMVAAWLPPPADPIDKWQARGGGCYFDFCECYMHQWPLESA